MKPIRLEIRGFTAFREPAVIEFEGRRLFVITGPTGAGKSSLLDAMTWALFGQVPRVGRSVGELLAQGEREMSAMFDFSVHGQTYRVARRYPSTNSIRLERIVEGRPVPMADRATEVTREVERLLGMDYATFTRAILLPQGQFDSFLRGEAKDRRGILGQLIGLGVYQRAGEIARVRAAESRTEADTVSRQLQQLAFATPEALASLQAQETALIDQQGQVQTRRLELQALGDLARAEHGLREAHERAESELRDAEVEVTSAIAARDAAEGAAAAQEREVTEATTALDAIAYDRAQHDRLKAVVALLDQRVSAEAAFAAAVADSEAAARGLTTAEAEALATNTSAREAEEHSRSASAALVVAAEALASAAGSGVTVCELLDAEVTTLERDAATADEEARRQESRVRDLELLRDALSASASDLERATAAHARARVEHESSATAAEAARAAQREAEAAVSEAQRSLEHARRDNAAADLRRGLKTGDPCPVCGEPIVAVADHPAPDIAAAETALAAATAQARDAAAATEEAVTARAAAEARVKETGLTLEAVAARRTGIDLQLTEADTAADNLDDAIAAARAAASDHFSLGTARRGLAREHGTQAQAIREALARVPESIEPSSRDIPPAAPPIVLAVITEAIRGHATAVETARTASTAAERSRAAAETAQRTVEIARRDLDRAQQTVVQARDRLATLGADDIDAEAARRTLATAEEQAREVEAITAQIAKAREAFASRAAASGAASQTVARAEEVRNRRRGALATARAAWASAHDDLVTAWQRQFVGTKPDLRELKTAMEECEATRVQVATDLERVRGGIELTTTQIGQSGRMRDEVAAHQASADLVGAVGNDLRNDRFIAFLLHESMQMLAADASGRLGQFTNGRYALKADEDEFSVIDHLNGDEERSVKTLSGGETFLASLALALSLSEHLPEIAGTGGAISLDSLFLDEGFGALDAEALDLAVQGLETLADGTRMIGVISHIEELAERLTDRIRVEKGPHGSTIAG
ncbi:MAG: SMC family ATPase [Chloroflexi bacterium]|nr:SMC family ATPase [Chloroflexota bacterium]